VVVFPAVPPVEREGAAVRQIVEELEKLARLLTSFPPAKVAGTRGPAPATSIAASLKKVNATLEDALRKESLGSAGFTTIGREFEKIGTTLQGLGTGSKTSAQRTKKKTTRR
jgi:hypothetical protein